jgi:membrane-bound lytic murein transglycosylase D
MKQIKIFIVAMAISLAMPVTGQVVNETDNQTDVLSLPEGMLENTDSMITEWNMSNYFQLDTTSQLANINPYFEEAVYIDRLKRLPNVMPMTYNSIVRKYIDQYTNRLRHSVSYMLGASNFYIPIFEDALLLYQLPLELKYLPVIESAFNPRARSRAGAGGLWQFMPATGKRYGLLINSLVDERCDPIKSSDAAARYLKDLYDIFGDWTLVIAAYNCGPGNINKAIHRAGGERDYWKIYPYLPAETRGYVPAFIAANYVMNYYGEHNILPMRASISANTDTLLLSHDVKMEQIAKICDIDIQQLKILNPQYTTNLIPGYRQRSTLRMPQKQLLTFIDLQDSIYSNVTQDVVLTEEASDVIEPVKTVSTRHSSSSRSRASSHKSRNRSQNVTVRKGQTLSEIARRNHTTVSKLRKLNGIRGNNIQAGKRIRVK